MKPNDGPGPLDILVVVLSPLLVVGLTVIYLTGWWASAAWRKLVGHE